MVGGGIQVIPGAVAYADLEELNLAGNLLSNLGFNSEDASPSQCWGTTWIDRFPKLANLNLQGNNNMQKLHPQAFSIRNLDISGCPSLTAPAVSNLATCSTSQIWQDAQAICAGYTWPVCLHAGSDKTLITEVAGLECRSLAALSTNLGSSFKLIVDEWTFNHEVLCSCAAGYIANGTSCSPVAVSGASTVLESDSSTLLVIIIVSSVVFCCTLTFAVYFIMSYSRNKQKKRESEALAAARAAAILESIIDDADMAKSQSTLTEQVFRSMNLSEIVEQGLKEHWVIRGESLELLEVAGKGGFGEVRHALLLGSTEVAIKIPRAKANLESSQIVALANEMRLFRRIRHPNIVLFNGVTAIHMKAEPVLCLVLEWIDGGDFTNYVSRRRLDGSFDLACQEQLKDPYRFMNEYTILIDIVPGCCIYMDRTHQFFTETSSLKMSLLSSLSHQEARLLISGSVFLCRLGISNQWQGPSDTWLQRCRRGELIARLRMYFPLDASVHMS